MLDIKKFRHKELVLAARYDETNWKELSQWCSKLIKYHKNGITRHEFDNDWATVEIGDWIINDMGTWHRSTHSPFENTGLESAD